VLRHLRVVRERSAGQKGVQMRGSLKFKVFGWLFVAGAMSLPQAWAHKFSIMSGLYSLSTTNPDTGAGISSLGLGANMVQYSVRIMPRLAAEVGYFLIIGDGFSGLDSNGIEAGATYYPLSEAEARTYQDEFVSLRLSDIWRPYIGAFFAQRQVLSASFAGYGAKGGTEWVFKAPWLVKVEGRFVSYSNALSPAIIELTGNIGIGIEF
jgi:hypothetical protein